MRHRAVKSHWRGLTPYVLTPSSRLSWNTGLAKRFVQVFCNNLRKNLNRPFGQPNRKTGYFNVLVQWWEEEKTEAEIQAVWGLQNQNGSFTSSKLPKHFREQHFVGENVSVSGISQKKKKKKDRELVNKAALLRKSGHGLPSDVLNSPPYHVSMHHMVWAVVH